MNITCKKVRGGWSATATKNGEYLCTRSGYKTQSRAERACGAAGRAELCRRQQHPVLRPSDLVTPAQAARYGVLGSVEFVALTSSPARA